MRLSRQFGWFHGTLNQPDKVGIKGSSGASQHGKSQSALTLHSSRPSYDQGERVALSRAPRGPFPLAPGIRSSPPGRASPAGRTQTRTTPAKFCSPRIVWFRECRAPVATWPAVHRSSPDDPVRHAISPWPHAPSRETTSGFLPTQQTSKQPRLFISPYRGFTSHIWDFTANSLRFPAPAFLYLFSCSSRQGEPCGVRLRQRTSAGADLGGNRGSES